MDFKLFSTIFLLAIIVHGLILNVILAMFKRTRKLSLVFLNIFTFIFSVAILGRLLFVLNSYSDHNVFYFHSSFLLGLGPSIYFFYKFQLLQQPVFRKKDLKHFIPVLFEFVFVLLSTDIFLVENYDFIYIYEQILAQISFLLYSIFSFRMIAKYEFKFGQDKKSIWLKILQFIHYFGLSIWVGYVAVNLIFFAGSLEIYYFYPLYFYSSIAIYTIVYLYIFASEYICFERRLFSKNDLEKSAEIIKKALEKEKLFLTKNLKISEFSKKIKLSKNEISTAINQKYNKNFSDFLNEYRVNEAKKMLVSSNISSYTIESIAKNCGFSSRSNFNLVFKKSVGLTPSEFIQQEKK
jgi:AraC-like DNA-binding protein